MDLESDYQGQKSCKLMDKSQIWLVLTQSNLKQLLFFTEVHLVPVQHVHFTQVPCMFLPWALLTSTVMDIVQDPYSLAITMWVRGNL